MPAHIVFPRHNLANLRAPWIFLMGPITNAPPWHEDTIDILSARARAGGMNIRICSPKREEDLVRKLPASCVVAHRSGKWPAFAPFPRQRAWEHFHLEEAAHSGGIICWLPAPGTIVNEKKAYGAISQLELGHWIWRAGRDPRIRFAIGSDGTYNGELHTITYDIERFAPNLLPIHDSLGSLCARALHWARTTYA